MVVNDRLKRIKRRFRLRFLREVFYGHSLEVIPKIEPKIQVAIKILNYSNIPEINQVKRFSDERLKMRLDRGDICFVAEKSGQVLSYHWLQIEGKHYVQPTGKRVEIKAGEAVIFDVHVHKDYRGNRLNGHVYSKILQYCKNNTFKHVWIYTDKKNVANRKGLEKGGFKLYKQTLSLFFNNRYHLLGSTRLEV